MQFQYIHYQFTEGVATITLNRPDVLNSFHRGMAQEVQNALAIIRDDDAIRAVLLTGEGRGFCAGQDLSEAVPAEGDLADLGNIVKESYNPIIRAIRNLEKPVICAVNGVAAGAGANLALACDIVLASAKASFIQAFCKIGVVPDSGGSFFLPRLVGSARAMAMMMLGDKISAQDAQAMGMIYKVCEPDSLAEEALKLARHLAQQPTTALGLTKRLLNKSLSNNLDTQLDLEEELQRQAGKTGDYKEGVRAFQEKRAPKFTGK